jgi:regulator of replication initiation timing
LHDCKESTIHISQRVQSSQSESELAKKLRQQLESQLNAKAEEAEVLNQTVLSQTARIEELCLQIRYIAQEREHEKNAMSQIHATAHSLASERDDLLSKLIAATDEANALRAENEKLKHNIRPSSSGTDCTDKTFSSCEYVGTVCEDEAPERDILLTDILQISDQDIHTVRNKMSELHSIISEVQEERSSLKQEIKHLRQFKDSYERLKHESSDLVHRDEVERMLQRTSQSYSSLKARTRY